MSKISLKKGMQQHFDDIKLSEEQLNDLMQLQNSKSGSTHQFSDKLRFISSPRALASLAATVVTAIALVFFIQNQPINMGEKIAYEVSKNHLKLKPLEVKSDQLNDLSKYFDQLDFMLVDTSVLAGSDWQLLGARYCSIQGNTAAQLRLKHLPSGNIETLYQAPYNVKQFSSIPNVENKQYPIEEYSKGMGVKIWVEKGVLFALTNNNLQN